MHGVEGGQERGGEKEERYGEGRKRGTRDGKETEEGGREKKRMHLTPPLQKLL